MKLKGKIALVTGAAQGIGRCIALALAREGADVALADLDIDRAQLTTREVEQFGGRAIALRVDVSDGASVRRMHKECVEKLGEVDILVNDAGIGASTGGIEVPEDEWDRVVDVNLKGTYLCCKAVVPGMVERGYGKIVSVSSQVAFLGSPILDLPYTASKAGIVGFTKTLARAVAARGVTVNAVAPGSIDTEMPVRGGRRTPEQWRAEVARITPAGRLGAPEEVAQVVLFLASDDSSYVTGETIAVAGGSLLR